MTPSLPWKPDAERAGTSGHQRHANIKDPSDGSVAGARECQPDVPVSYPDATNAEA
jgi:hypothetical protein